LFGYVDGGTIQNVTVSGSITSTANDSCVGGIVGYTTGGIYNCHNQVTISITNTSASQVGGIAGTVENTNSSGTRYVQYCSNTAAITGRSRIGGIVGAVYCSGAGGVIVDNCYNLGNLTNNSTTTRAYVGGIVGFCRGYIQNCYSICTLTAASSGHYMAGLVGILQGSDPQAKLSNSYTVPVFRNATIAQDHWAFASADRSNDLPISDVLWCTKANTDEGGTSGILQETADGDNGWGAWTRCGSVTEDVLSDYGSVTVYTTNTDGTTGSTTSTVSVQNVLGDKFAKASSTSQNGGYPVLTWQNDGLTYSSFTPGSDGTAITADAFYLSSSGNDDYDGTSAQTPVRTLSRAVGLANATTEDTATIYVMDPITLNTASIYGNAYTDTDGDVGNKVTVAKASSFTGSTDAMFTVPNGNTVYLGGINFNGAGFTTTFDVSGTLYIRSQASVFGSNTAFNVASTGRLTLNRSDITGTQYSVKVATKGYFEIGVASTQTFSMSGTVYLDNDAKIVFSDPVPCAITVECAFPVGTGRVIASGSNHTLDTTDAAKVSYFKDAEYYPVACGENNTLVVNPTPVYLNGNATSNGTGTLDSPYNDLESAIAGARAKGNLIRVLNTVTFDATATYNDQVVIERETNYNGAMFKVGASNAVVTMGGAAIDAGGIGTIFEVPQGQLKLDNGIIVRNAAIAVNLTDSGQLEVNSAAISASQYAVKVGSSGASFLVNGSDITVDGTIYLASGKYITVTAAIPCDLTVQCASPAVGTVIAVGIGYNLTQTDADYVSEYTDAYGVMEVPETYGNLGNTTELLLVERIYLDGTKPDGGDGTKENPYNDLATALGVVNSRRKILVTGTTPLTSGTYSASMTATVQRGPELTGPMFTVDDGASVILSRFTITGRGTGTIVQVVGGTLDLKGGVELSNCDMAVDMVGGNVTVSQTVISAKNYSIRVGANSGTITLYPSAVTKIDGAIYLTTGKQISVTKRLDTNITGTVTVEPEADSSGTIIATCSSPLIATQSVGKLIVNGVAAVRSGNSFLVA
jgi:hypothetical protein